MLSADTQKEKIDEIINNCELYRQQLIAYCMHYGCTKEEAEDCVADSYRKLIEKLHKGDEIKNHRAWLYKVSINQAKSLKIKKASENIIDLISSEEKQNALESIAVEVDYVEEAVASQSIGWCAVKILSLLDSDERELYVKYYREGKRLNTIASELGISHANARKRKERLKNRLEVLVAEYGDDIYVLKKEKGGKHDE